MIIGSERSLWYLYLVDLDIPGNDWNVTEHEKMLQARVNQEAIDIARKLLIWHKSWKKVQQEARASSELGTTACEFNFHDHDTVQKLKTKFIPLCFTVVDLILFPCELSTRLMGVSFANEAKL